MTVYENMLLLEERVKKATAYIKKLRAEIEELKRNVRLITAHNEELQSYVDAYKEDEERIAQSIATSLEALNEVGLDNLDLSVEDFEVAEQFSATGGDSTDEIDVSDLDDLNL